MKNDSVPQHAFSCYRTALRKPLLTVPQGAGLIFQKAWVLDRIQHRPPFVFVEGIQAIENEIICASFDFAQPPYIFETNLPVLPLLPGTIQIEAMAQAGLLLYSYLAGDAAPNVRLGIIHNAKFIRTVEPGDPVQILASCFDDGLFVAIIGQTVQSGRPCSACLLSAIVEKIP